MAPEDQQSARQDLYWIIAIFFLSLAVRFTVLWIVSDVDVFFSKYSVLAERLKDNHFLTPEVFAYCPLYIYFLAFLLTLTGGATLPILVAQILYGSLGAVLAYSIARKLADRRTAVIAGLILAFSRSMVLYEVNLLADSLWTFLELALVAALLIALERPTLKRWTLCGFLLGLSVALRPTSALALAGLVPAIWYLLGATSRGRRLVYVAILVGVTFLTTLPITIQNIVLAKDLVPIVSQGGYVFYASNNYASSAVRYAPPLLLPAVAGEGMRQSKDPVPFYDDALSVRIATAVGPGNLRRSQVSRFYVSRALDPVKRYPAYFAKLFFRKVLGIVSSYEVHDTLEANVKKNKLSRLPLVPYGVVFSLGAAGIFVTRRHWRMLVPLYVMGATQIVTLLLFYVVPRFRLPLEAILSLFAAFAVGWWLQSPRRRSVPFFVGLAAVAFLSFVPRTDVMRQVERDQGIQNALAEGKRHASSGELDGAIRSVNRVIELVDNPTSPLHLDAHRQLAALYLRMGDEESARLATEKAQPIPLLNQAQLLTDKIKIDGASPWLLTLVGEKYREAGKWAEARQYLAGALDLAPENPTVRYRLAEALLATGGIDEAMSNMDLALQDGLDFTRFGLGAHYHLWKFHRDRDPAEAQSHWEMFQRLSWIFEYLTPTPMEIQAMEEMGVENPSVRE